ncbi:AT-rich interactive domain-containing protein 1A-like isoform X1 [Styela clava]
MTPMMKSPSDHAVDTSMSDPQQQRQTYNIPEKSEMYGMRSKYGGSPSMSQGSNSWSDVPQQSNQIDQSFQPSPANSSNSQYNMEQQPIENSQPNSVNSNGISGAAAAAAAAMAAAAHSAKTNSVYHKLPGPAILPSQNPTIPMHGQQQPQQQQQPPQHMPPPMQHRMPFHPNYSNVQQANMGMQSQPPHDPAAYQNHSFGGYHHPPPPRQPMMQRVMPPGGHQYPTGHMPQWRDPGMQPTNSPDMRMRYVPHGYDDRPHPSYHPHLTMTNAVGPMENSMMHDVDDMKPKISASGARSSSQKLSALYDPPDEPGRKEFVDRVLQYWEEKELPLKHAPLMGRRTLDLFTLYQHVKKKGFMQEVTRSKEWTEISNAMGLGNTSATGFTLKKQYCKYLYGFECRFERGEPEPQEALARVIEANRKKKQADQQQQQVKMGENKPMNPAMMRPPHPGVHPDMQRQVHPPKQYLPSSQMDPYSQHRRRVMPGSHMEPNSVPYMQMPNHGMPYVHGQHGQYRHDPSIPPTSYGHPQQLQQQQYRGDQMLYRANNGYINQAQTDPNQTLQLHQEAIRPPGPVVSLPISNINSPYYRDGPRPAESMAPSLNPNLSESNAFPVPNADSANPHLTDWPKPASVMSGNDSGGGAGTSENVQTSLDETTTVSSTQENDVKSDATHFPSTASTPKPTETTESNLPNTAPSTPALTSSSSSTPVPSTSNTGDTQNKDIVYTSEDMKAIITKSELMSSPSQSPQTTTHPLHQKSSEKAVDPTQQLQPSQPQMPNQFGLPPKPQNTMKQEMNRPVHAPSPLSSYPFAAGSPMPQSSPRPFIDNRTKMERPMHPGMYASQHPYHQQPPYRGMTPMQHRIGFGKRASQSIETYGPPNKMPRSDMGHYPDGYQGPPVRPPSQGSEMHQYPYNRSSIQRPVHPEVGHYGPQPMSSHPQNYHHYTKHVRPPGPHADPVSPYLNTQAVQQTRQRGSATMGTSDSASKFLQGLVKDYSPSPQQHHSNDLSTIHRSSSSRSHPQSSHNVRNSQHQHPFSSQQQSGSSSTHGPLFPPGCVEAIQPSFANFREKTCQDVGVIEAWKVVMSLKSGLLAESTWALNALTILLHDQNTIRHIVLHQLPGLLHTVIEHYRCCLHELFAINKETGNIEPDCSDEVSTKDDSLGTYSSDSISKHKANCFAKPKLDGKYFPAPSNLQSPFNKCTVKMSIESEENTSLREDEWSENEEELTSERLHIIPSFSGNSVFEYAKNDVCAPISSNAEEHAAEVTLEDMLSVHNNDRCLSPNKLDDFSEECSLPSHSESNVKESICNTKILRTTGTFSDSENPDNLFAADEDKASHIQSCLDRISWKCNVVLMEDEATGFPGNSGLLIPYSKGGRYFLSSGGEHIFPKKLKEKESELVSRTLCLSNLIRGLSCALFNHVDLCTHEDFLKTLAGTLMQCHKHRVRHFNSRKPPLFMESTETLVAEEGITDTNAEDVNTSFLCREDTIAKVSKSESVPNIKENLNVNDASQILNKRRKRVLSVTLHDCTLSMPELQNQVNGISSDTPRSDEDEIQSEIVTNKKFNSTRKKSSHPDEQLPCSDKKTNKNNIIKDTRVAAINGECLAEKQLQNEIRPIEHEDTHQKLANETVKSILSCKHEDQNDKIEHLDDNDQVSEIKHENAQNDHSRSAKILLSSTVLHENASDREDVYGFYNHPWWWECVRQVREDSLITLANLSMSMNLSQFTNENTIYTIIDTCLHWSVCSSADAQDPFPSNSLRTILSPQSLCVEILTKLSMKEDNVDLILATRPYRRLEKLFQKLTIMVGNRKDQMLREFAIVLLSNFSEVESAARAIALQSGAISNLLSFLEECEETGLNNQRMFPAGQELNCGTISYMMKRCALTLLRLARINENRPLFMKHHLRLLSLSMAVLLGSPVLSILSSILYELNNELPNR